MTSSTRTSSRVKFIESLQLEYSIHEIPKTHKDDIVSVWPLSSPKQMNELKIVSTCQRAQEDLVKMGEKV